ncbi:hypothetical protein [Rubricoccus marinus]|uniref:YqgF/RNase H-like domain-containing protein n=1 Tax=Rubricoccus marinus TaxID=716817 RepID=A0A259TWW1_9BACT|nr:hypothetical protein [Rubricoccus marinus]OZC02262.1 hypothetical protein BSZ36_04220 [Rubricoccus marinus]
MPPSPIPPEPTLLAVDLGVRTGLAFFDARGRLLSYRSQNLGSRARLKRAAHSLLAETPELERLVLEGGGNLAELWKAAGLRRDLRVRIMDAGVWRRGLLLPRERRSGALAKEAADAYARRIITWSEAANPKGKLKHDVAEAICIGLWACVEAGWLDGVPPEVRR